MIFRKKFWKHSIPLIALLMISLHVYSQTLPLTHYTRKNGLQSSFVTRIFQDSKGYIWVGTELGLSLFDGKEFQPVFDEKKGLKNDFIITIFEDINGKIWIGTRGAGLICKDENGIRSYTRNDGLPNDRISSIIDDENGNLWIGTHGGLCRFNGKTFTSFHKENGLIDDYINCLIRDKYGNLWIGSEQGLSRIRNFSHIKNPKFDNFSIADGLSGESVKTFAIDHLGFLWIGTINGLDKINPLNPKIVFQNFSSRNGMINSVIYTIIEDQNHYIWIGTGNGISLYDGSKFTNFGSKNGFLDPQTISIYNDREGNIWFGTVRGLSRLQSLRITNFSTNDGLADNMIWGIIEEKEGTYWIATDNGLTQYIDGKFKTFTTKDGLISNNIYNILKVKSGKIWLATGKGINILDPSTYHFKSYTVKDGLPYEVVLTLSEGLDGVIWIGTSKGLCRWKDGRILLPNFETDPEPRPIHAILNDSRGNLWYTDTTGLWKIKDQIKKLYTTEDGLIENAIYAMMEDSKGRIWICTKRGISCFSDGKFTNYTTANGLSDNNCYSLLEDNDHKLWITTVNGLNSFDFKTFKTYSTRDGLISDEMSHCTCLKDSEGYLWFGTVNGLVRFNSRLDKKNTVPPPIYITQFTVMGKNYPQTPNIELKYNENYIKFSFVGLCFTSPEDVLYRYRLNGMDTQWFESSHRYISYPSLPPGTYTFQVFARNNNGIESTHPAEIHFIIYPPFWKTWWFTIIYILLFIFLAGLVVLYQNKRVKERVANEAKNKQLIMAQKMKLLGVLAGGAVHDLKNLLSIIIGYSELVHDCSQEVTEEEKNEAIEIIKNTADTAFQVVKQILALAKQNYDEVKSSDLSELCNEILSILKITIPSTIEIYWTPPEEKILFTLNPVKFKQIVLNLCLNAVHAMGKTGDLKISLEKMSEPPQILVAISDTGHGIPPEYIDKIFEPLFTTKDEEKGSGLGLFVVKQIVDEYHGKITVDSTPNVGTTFKIFFPDSKSPTN